MWDVSHGLEEHRKWYLLRCHISSTLSLYLFTYSYEPVWSKWKRTLLLPKQTGSCSSANLSSFILYFQLPFLLISQLKAAGALTPAGHCTFYVQLQTGPRCNWQKTHDILWSLSEYIQICTDNNIASHTCISYESVTSEQNNSIYENQHLT